MTIFIMQNLIFFSTSDDKIVGFLRGVTKRILLTIHTKLSYTRRCEIDTMLVAQDGVCVLTDFHQVKHTAFINKKLQDKLFERVPIKGD